MDTNVLTADCPRGFAATEDLTADNADGTDVMNRRETKEEEGLPDH